MAIPIYVIIVTHNSAEVLDICLAHLANQTTPIKAVAIVDSGSDDPGYLDAASLLPRMRIIKTANVGFSKANNIGFEAIVAESEGMVVFINPDTFLPPEYLALAVTVLDENPGAAVVSGKLLGFDRKAMRPSGKIDSTGIFKRWYGRWYDRGQGEEDRGQYHLVAALPAVCGALICCRLKALQPYRGTVFDPDFFLYKEDVDLALRLRAAGWILIYDPRLYAYHCRGWAKNRARIGYNLRLIAAQSDVLLCQKHPGPAILWALAKLFLVRVFHL